MCLLMTMAGGVARRRDGGAAATAVAAAASRSTRAHVESLNTPGTVFVWEGERTRVRAVHRHTRGRAPAPAARVTPHSKKHVRRSRTGPCPT